MSLDETYSDRNIFAKIIRGEMPKVAVYEDAATLAFMDVFPQSEGHTLVISKTAQAVNLLDLPTEALSDVMKTAQTVSRAIVQALKPDGFRLVQFNGSPAGQTVFHTHVHIIPIWEGRSLGAHGSEPAAPETLEATAEKIRHAL